jgi:hypothetical protein
MSSKNDQKINGSNQYIILFNKKKHIIKLKINENRILFTVICQERDKDRDKKNIYFLHQTKIESLHQNSKILQLYKSPHEFITLFDLLFKNKKIYLEYNNISNEIDYDEKSNDYKNCTNKELFLIIKLNIFMKEEILLLPLEKKYEDLSSNNITTDDNDNDSDSDSEKEKEDLYHDYMELKQQYEEMIVKHEKEIEKFNNEIKELKEQNNDLKLKINNLLKQVEQFNDLIITNNGSNKKYSLSNMKSLIDRIEFLEELKEESTKSSRKTNDGIDNQLNDIQFQEQIQIKKLKKCFKSSSILNKETYFDFLLNKLLEFNPISCKIIYKSSIDGDNVKKFHYNCDGEENVLIIIETLEGLKFGGFTSVGFDGNGYELRDDKAFLFSIDKQKIYDIIQGNNAIYCNRRFGPIFCSKTDSSAYSIFIPDRYLTNKSTTTKKCFCYTMKENFEINNGKKEFLIKELEVFRVDYDYD